MIITYSQLLKKYIARNRNNPLHLAYIIASDNNRNTCILKAILSIKHNTI